MTQTQFLILWLTSFAFILVCRVLPALALRGMPIVAAGIVVLVAWRTRSMLWCCVSGVVAYVLLSLT